MMRTARLLTATLAAGLFLATVAVLPAAAGTRVTQGTPAQGTQLTGRPGGVPGLPVRPRSVLTLTVNDGEKFDPATARSRTLTCEPSGGTHPDPATACKQLLAVNGDFTKLNVDPGPCILIFKPVFVTAKGTWRGKYVAYEQMFPNSCVLARTTGAVFAF